MLARLGQVICCGIFLASAQPSWATETNGSLPPWLAKAIAEEKKTARPGTFEESTYQGKRVYLFIRGDRVDTGDEHVLFSKDGEEICKFGGYVGRVTSGVCDIDKIIYVRTLYPN